ncbi:delta(14)-sterol reductase TM7SF2 [Onthophagus taurus]|uniref:delta(14)-sterol reductase TM7SF2 n=1 Tax=Onthophagus taurus TaxID=166361 RepID=UPI0039BDED44
MSGRVPKEETIRASRRSRPTRSPARKKSPARTPKTGGKRSGSKSPSRKSESMITTPTKKRSPARGTPSKKSPSRIPRTESFKEPSLTKITTSTPILDVDTDSDVETKIPKPSTQIRGRTRTSIRKEITSVRSALSNLDLDGLTMRVTRSMTPKEIDKGIGSDKIVHLKEDFFTKRESKLIEYSDEDDVPLSKRIDLMEPIFKPNLQFRIEYGGMWGTLFLIVFLPLFTITIAQYTIMKSYPNLSKIAFYFDLYSYLGFAIFALINFIVSMIRFGPKPEGQLKIFASSNFVANGIINFVVSLGVVFGLEFYGFQIFDYVNGHYLQLTAGGLLFGIFLSVVLFVKAHYVPVSALNIMGDTDSFIYNFFIGKEVSPVIFGVHMKIYLIRLVHIGRSILTTAILSKSLDINKIVALYPNLSNIHSLNLNYSLLAICFMTYITMFDRIFYEKVMASTFEIRHEGHGYLTNVYFMSTLFLYGLIPKYVHDARLQLNPYILGLVCLVFFIGYIINRGSMNQKYWFRVNPFHSSVSYLSTIQTSQGKKLLCGGFWGIVRHPNYFGEIMMNLSYAPFTCGSGLLIYILCTIPALIYRTTRVEFRLKQRYEVGWDRYCENVRKMFIPKVF